MFGARFKYDHVANRNTTTQASPEQRRPTRNRQKSKPRAKRPIHLDTFFASYPAFLYNPSESVVLEFRRMCGFFNWNVYGKEREVARKRLQNAMSKQFTSIYGTDVRDINSWQKLCRVIKPTDPVPEELEACRNVVRKAHVNIVDLLDAATTRKAVVLFDSEEQLSAYTKDTGKCFPARNAVGVVKFLLRNLSNPRLGGKGKRKRGEGGEWSPSSGRG